ncbi:MAG TPA: cytochrome B [Planctomycetes bacterium]|nr:cytochrome B [Planctomycetota bacterium]
MKKEVKFYSLHERIWHWIQALTILVLIVTGFEVHAPGRIHLLGFELAVVTHTVFAVVLLANAAMGLFYFLTSGAIRQYVPGESGFFVKALRQAQYYLGGIFRGEPHPFEATPGNRLNPLQKVTYLMILNVLLPVQVVTGVLIWGAERWPDLVATVGGLALLVPIHALASWLFLSFIVMHIYLTTTGETPTANLKAMLTGFHESEEEAK